jgi:hypothetical protein
MMKKIKGTKFSITEFELIIVYREYIFYSFTLSTIEFELVSGENVM